MYLCTKIQESQQDMDEKKSLTVKDWANEDKPREKMLNQGARQLTNAELIAILLRSGLVGKSVLDVAKEILQSADNSLSTLSRMDYKQLRSIKGLGDAKATTLMAALELGWRLQSEINTDRQLHLPDSTAMFNYMLPTFASLDHEEFWAIYLNLKHKVIERQRISIGGQTDTSVDLRILFRGALECKATLLAVAHNHPAGTLSPSSLDKKLTHQINEAGKLLGVKLVDHIIIGIGPHGRPDYYSFNDNGLV